MYSSVRKNAVRTFWGLRKWLDRTLTLPNVWYKILYRNLFRINLSRYTKWCKNQKFKKFVFNMNFLPAFLHYLFR